LATALPVPAIPGLTGDSASARWLAMVDAVSNAATAPNTHNERRTRTEIANIDASSFRPPTAQHDSQHLTLALSTRRFSTRDVFS
jgi:hypothetical protein